MTVIHTGNESLSEKEQNNVSGTIINPFIHKLELDTSADKIQVL